MAVAHYLEALDWQREFIKLHAILGGKNPHLQSFLVGGMATPIDPDKQAALNVGTIADAQASSIAKARDFVEHVYIPDLLAIASFYKDWAGYRRGRRQLPRLRRVPATTTARRRHAVLPARRHPGRDLTKVEPFDPAKITEYVTHSWYEYPGGDDEALHPSEGETQPNYTGPKPPYERLDTTAKYSWLKSPRYDDQPMEVGPLARMLVAYASGHDARQGAGRRRRSRKLGVGPEALFSTLGRVAARGHRDRTCSPRRWATGSTSSPTTWAAASCASTTTTSGIRRRWPDDGDRRRLPRGAARRARPLGAHRERQDRATTSASCRARGTPVRATRTARAAPYEAALLGTPVADPEQPLEILRTVHSFDPCMACGVHVVDAEGRSIAGQGACEGGMSAWRRTTSSSASTCGTLVVRSRTG